MHAVGAKAERPVGAEHPPRASTSRAPFAAVLTLTVTLAAGCFLLVMPAVLLVAHPVRSQTPFASLIGQNQAAKTLLYVSAFAVILPLALIAAPRLADAVAAGRSGAGLEPLAALLAGSLAGTVIVVRLLPLGLGVLLAGVGAWALLAGAALIRAIRPGGWPLLLGLRAHSRKVAAGAAGLVFGAVLCVTHLGALSGVATGAWALAGAGALIVYEHLRLPRAGRKAGLAVDSLVVLLLLLAIPDVVVFKPSPVPPSIYLPPGVIQFQHDWILAPVNQLLGGGALLVNVPSSQYGVGLVYFVAGWFHIAPIGYGTFGLLDGSLTALLYVAGYAVLRVAGVSRLLAAAGLALGVVAFLYHLRYPVGQLPELGPLRFGLPMGVILAMVLAARWPSRAPLARAGALAIVGLSSVWAIEAFAYTVFTFAAIVSLEGVLRAPGRRAHWLAIQAGLALGACLAAHLVLAVATLAGSGHLPDWSQYLAYVRGLLLGGREGAFTYGFSNWSSGLAVGAVCLASAAAIVLLAVRARPLLARQRTRLLATCGVTAYAIASLSYTDNRSSTYLFLYIGLPVLMIAVLWMSMLVGPGEELSRQSRRGALVFALAVAVLMLGAAWPTVSSNFSQSALAHAYPGGGLRASLHRLWHPPPIDPRAPDVERLLDRYMPGSRPLILFPSAPDLAIEALMRRGRANPLFLGDPSEDMWVPSVWVSKLTSEIARLQTGRRVLVDGIATRVMAGLRGLPAGYALQRPVLGGNPEVEWILHQIDIRFRLGPVHSDRLGFHVFWLLRRGSEAGTTGAARTA